METYSYSRPISALKRISTIAVKLVDLPGRIEERAIRNRFQSSAVGMSVKIVSDGSDCDAILFCRIHTLVSASLRDVAPLAYGYVVSFELLTTLEGQPRGELFNIWSLLAFGNVLASELEFQLCESAEQLIRKMFQSIAQSKDQ